MWKLLQKIFHKLRDCLFPTGSQLSDEDPDKETSSKEATTAATTNKQPQSETPILKKDALTPVDPCRPVLHLARQSGVKPVLLIGYYQPNRQEHPTDATFSHLFLYPYSRKRSDLQVFTPSAYVKDARPLADKLVKDAPAQKKYQMLLVAYPEATECNGTLYGILRPAFDITDEPLLFRIGKKVTAPKSVIQQCFRPDLRPYLKKKNVPHAKQSSNAPNFRKETPKTKDELQIERWNRVLKQKRSSSAFQKDFIRTPLIDIAEQAGGRPVIFYGTFIPEKRPNAVRSCFRDIKPYFPNIPEYAIKVITDHLMIEDAGNRSYSFGQIRQKTERYGRRVLLIGYPHLYINKGFVRCGFRLAKNLGVSAILYGNTQKNGRFILPDAVLAKCFLPNAKDYLEPPMT
ncbi:hypothetical protein [uncultured Selenomonas sp.]|uniref:hypothetical protein n=1 Tax=uncultured Selenomonas sp. TaxID=159275 RepID=UPI0025D87288|nr:hypothetical protein [uncultured Selenomonas sp.]